MKKVALILAGCGVYDGSEIHEATLTMFYLEKAGFEIQYFAPDKQQRDVINHKEGSPVTETRNVLLESARISRGNIAPITELNVDNFDAVVFPGGFGAAKNLCSFAVDGANCEIDSYVSKAINEAVSKKKAVGAMCIAPVVVAKALKDSGLNPKLTIGTDKGTSDALKELNAEPIPAQVNEVVVDSGNKIVSTPAYMLGTKISEVASGIEKFVDELKKLV
ncbi:MAG: isoprenoid biosynthesis glyoxalase ElbB [candidate division Zixibacteria bacterium]|nr:isoprenoid biosynthesis glyoxalase ElbB [candidate division Zixibacteria bacterium]